MEMQNKRFVGILAVIAILLLIPFIAMQITGEVNWNLFDFIVAGILLLGFGLIFEISMRVVKETKIRIIACAVILVSLLIIWAELAVGIFGTPFAGS